MSIIQTITLIGVMIALAAIPSTSVALVVTRSAALGISNGIAVTAGIVLGDLVFVMLAIYGLSVLAETMGALFMIIKYLGAAYLIWFGISLIRTKDKTRIADKTPNEKGNIIASFLAGLALTLGDIKAVLFYSSLFPVFIDLSEIQVPEFFLVALITTTSVGSVKILYALAATKIVSITKGKIVRNVTRKTAGGIMVGAGSYIIIKA